MAYKHWHNTCTCAQKYNTYKKCLTLIVLEDATMTRFWIKISRVSQENVGPRSSLIVNRATSTCLYTLAREGHMALEVFIINI